MKISKYNIFIEKNDKVIAYNSFTNSLALMKNDDYRKFKQNINCIDNLINDSLYDDLKKGGFIIENNVDEIELLKVRVNKGRYDQRKLSLTILPTSDCNFRCIYCFEKSKLVNKSMSQETMESIIALVEENSKTIESLYISWYGGEPLLEIDKIKYMTKKFLKICKENDIKYSAGIITNGYLLTENNLKTIYELKIDTIQITIDGNKDAHNSRRMLKSGAGTYDKIINNLTKNINYLPKRTSLRINVDKSNYENIFELMGLLTKRGLNKKIYPYLGRVTNSNNEYNDNICFTPEEFSEKVLEFNNRIKMSTDNSYPVLVSNSCTADSINSFVIDSDGKLYRCWEDVGFLELSTGNIDKILLNKNFTNYLNRDIFLKDECAKCKILPICMGGCPRKQECSTEKFLLENKLEKIVEEKSKTN